MHLLYCDESGSAPDPNQKHFVLAGISLFERQGFAIANELDKIVSRVNPDDTASTELHGSPIYGGKKFWRHFEREFRYEIIKDSLSILSGSHPSNRIFACIINKEKASPRDPVEVAFEQIASRFDHYLARLYNQNNTQRGIIIFDKSTYETAIQGLATNFRTVGHSWGVLRNLSEVPLFLDSKASRLIQLADLVAYSIFRKYEHGDTQFFSIIENRFDQVGGIKHGLCEKL
ncbi:DUF3800 domain-containing protein [Dyadobacter sp. CY356]|uniref:DUF3800 domain-containing protein n=1 Tax=Dyadobacter sp. CY356 TaxID=2906442 RepID=UPI001F2CFB34|nr:DUF3800 domain-containing protein [Dyadobacter sp. CY356]